MAKLIDCRSAEPRDIYKLMLSFIGPRPIGWISTISPEGVPNLAPFSFFNMLSMNPAVLGFSVGLKDGGAKKDTLRNVEATKSFVHNVVTKDLVEKMNSTAKELPYNESEFPLVGLTPLNSSMVKAPRVKEAKISCECELIQIVSLGSEPGNGQLVLGNVVAIHINDESLLTDRDDCDAEKLELVSRLGRLNYAELGRIFALPR